MDGFLVPCIDGGGNSVHGMNPSHERDRDSLCKEVDKSIFIVDFAEGCIVFELGYVIPKLWI